MKKTENTPQNKAEFFAQYWGQAVATPNYHDFSSKEMGLHIFNVGENTIHNQATMLLLRPVCQITDEDAIEVAKICSHYFPINEDVECEVFINSFGRKVVSWGKSYKEKFLVEHAKDTTQGADFLRSKGYLLPWRDLSVEEIISYGWAKYEA